MHELRGRRSFFGPIDAGIAGLARVPVVPVVAGAILSVLTLGLSSCSGGGSNGAGSGAGQGTGTPLSLAGHTLRRVAFGPTPALLDALTQHGTHGYIEEQLDPASIADDDAQLTALLAQIPVPQSELDQPSIEDLTRLQIVRAIYSKRQLQEQLAGFWGNHFCTTFDTVKVFAGESTAAWFEWRENELFRAKALGSFHDLLLASATSPAMLVDLDNISNVMGAPNENYARELMELHTLGVDNGYAQHDVEEVARCFTGWMLCRVAPADVGNPLAPCSSAPGALWSFHFDPVRHDAGAKTIFTGTAWELDLPARAGNAGLEDGFDVLDRLASMPGTAEFVCRKLAAKFVGGAPQASGVAAAPPASVIAAAKAEWMHSGGDIRSVVRAILLSSDFEDLAQRWSKVSTPLENLCATVRALQGRVDQLSQLTVFAALLDGKLDQALFRWPDPDGYPQGGLEQLGTAKLLGRAVFARRIPLHTPIDVDFDVPALLASRGIAAGDAGAIVDELLRLFVQDDYTPEDRSAAVNFLSTGLDQAPAPLDPLAPDYADRVHLCAAYLASLPQSLQQ